MAKSGRIGIALVTPSFGVDPVTVAIRDAHGSMMLIRVRALRVMGIVCRAWAVFSCEEEARQGVPFVIRNRATFDSHHSLWLGPLARCIPIYSFALSPFLLSSCFSTL